jgi:hypothetical protein
MDLRLGFQGRCGGAAALLLLNLAATDRTFTVLFSVGSILAVGVYRGDLLFAVLAASTMAWMSVSALR